MHISIEEFNIDYSVFTDSKTWMNVTGNHIPDYKVVYKIKATYTVQDILYTCTKLTFWRLHQKWIMEVKC